MIKKAMYYLDMAFDQLNSKYSSDIPEGKSAQLIGAIHDEIITYIPGEATVTDVKKIKDDWVAEYKYPELSYEFSKAQEQSMKKAMDDFLHPLVPNFPSKADCFLGTSWSAK